MSIQPGHRVAPLLLGSLALTALLAADPARAQVQVPIHGLTGTIALPDNVDKFYSGMNILLVKTSDGMEHVIHVTKATKVHGGPASLDSLRPGTAVVVHYTVKGIQTSADEIDRIGPDGLKTNEGTVESVDRVKKRITIKFANGASETLRLTHHAALDSEGHTHSRVIVYYSDESGRKVAHYFKPAR